MALDTTASVRVRSIVFASLIVVLLTASTAAAQSVRGTATYRERMTLPPGATFEAVLEDVSRADAPAEVLGRTQMTPPGNPPISFEVRYDPARILPTRTYRIRARILLAEQLLFTTDTAHPVLTRGGTDTVSVVMRRVATGPITPPSAAAPLQQTYWKATELAGKPVATGAHLVLAADGAVAGSDGCNRFAGTYEVTGEALRFGRLAVTRMACPNTADSERAFHDLLNRAAVWRITGNRLDLFDTAGSLLGRFDSAPKP